MKKAFKDLLNLFFPELCLLCGTTLIEGEQHICLHCLNDLHYKHYVGQDEIHSFFWGKSAILGLESFLVFEKDGIVQQLIHELKYHNNKKLASYLGRLAFLQYKNNTDPICDVDLLLPVPLHPKKLRMRGYNQSEWIAKGIASVIHVPIETALLARKVHTETQTSRKTFERWKNMEDVFELKGDSSLLQNKRVLLVDDVLTSGSTFNACANVLEEIPGIKLSAFSLAMV